MTNLTIPVRDIGQLIALPKAPVTVHALLLCIRLLLSYLNPYSQPVNSYQTVACIHPSTADPFNAKARQSLNCKFCVKPALFQDLIESIEGRIGFGLTGSV